MCLINFWKGCKSSKYCKCTFRFPYIFYRTVTSWRTSNDAVSPTTLWIINTCHPRSWIDRIKNYRALYISHTCVAFKQEPKAQAVLSSWPSLAPNRHRKTKQRYTKYQDINVPRHSMTLAPTLLCLSCITR